MPRRNRRSPVEQENSGLLSVLHRSLSPGDTFLDVGANVGEFAIDVAIHVGPTGRVLAFEPADDAADELRTSAERSGVLGRIDIFQVALGARTDRRSLHADPSEPEDWTKRSLFLEGPVVAEVAVRSFDDLVRTGEIALPLGLHAVKIDVEGAEVEALLGMSRTLRELRPRVVVVETMIVHQERAGSSVADIDAILTASGYSTLPEGPDVPRFVYNTVYVDRDRR
jgi:FkbM family methyltransferase